LVRLGYSREEAEEGLRQSEGDVDAAISHLMSR